MCELPDCEWCDRAEGCICLFGANRACLSQSGGVNMFYPCLIPDWALNAIATVSIAGEGVSEDGEMLPELKLEKKCNIQ